MKSRTVEIRNEEGLHVRPATLIAKTARKYAAKLEIKSLDEVGNIKEISRGDNIMDLLSMALQKGRKIILEAEGEDEDKLLEEMYELIEIKKFGEK